MFITVFNSSDRPVTIDSEGRELGGRDWGVVSTTTDQTKDALRDGGAFIKVDLPLDHPVAKMHAVITGRHDDLTGRDKTELAALAADAGVDGAEELNVASLVHTLSVQTNVTLPAAKPAKATPKEH